MPSPVAIAVVVLALVYAILRARIHFTQHIDEPPAILTGIPFMSPILGILRRRYKIYLHLFHQYKLPIYTLRLPLARLYIVNDSSLISSIERQPQIIAFSAIQAEATTNLLGMSEATNATIKGNLTGENAHFTSFHHAVRPVLAPGPGLDKMNCRSANCLAASLAYLRTGQTSSTTVSLFAWVQHEIIMATTDAEYGPANPFRDPEFEKAWHTFESSVPILSTTPTLGPLLSPAALAAREFLAARLAGYFAAGHHINGEQGGSAFLLARHAHGVERGLTPDDIARGELGACLAILNNTVAAAYWLVVHVFSDPVVLGECRRELERDVVTNEDGERVVDLDCLKASCPVLVSTLQEVMRFRGVGTLIIRKVMEDYLLAGRWMLKKGSVLLMPNLVQQYDPAVWGADAGVFDHRRFMKKKGAANPRALRIWGSGSTLCPGRHFATTEMLAFAALMVLQFDVRPEVGRWVMPRTDGSFGLGVARIFLMPENDFEVELVAREPRLHWRVLLTESKKAVHTVAEDIEAHEKMEREQEPSQFRRESV